MLTWLIFKITHKKVILMFLIQQKSLIFYKSKHRTNKYVQEIRVLVPSQILVILCFFWKLR